MRACRDTFLHFLADNLATVTVHAMRRDLNDATAANFQTNAINVSFIKDRPDVLIGSTTALLDIVFDNELACIDAVSALWTLLSTQFMTPKFDYSSGSPVAVNTNLMWEPHTVNFKQVFDDFSFHYTCTLLLQHRPI